MKITLARALAGHKNGATIERTAKVAQHLIAHGAAVKAERPERSTSDDAKSGETKAEQTRRSSPRKAKGRDGSGSDGSDKTAGQKGGGVPPPALS